MGVFIITLEIVELEFHLLRRAPNNFSSPGGIAFEMLPLDFHFLNIERKFHALSGVGAER